MILYHGTDHKSLEIQNWIVSRYGITVLFVSPDKELAIRYAQHAKRRRGKGYLYQLEANPIKTIDWQGKISFTPAFRNMVFREHKLGIPGVLIKNVIDYPDSEQATFLPTSVAIIYDVDTITNLKLLQTI